LGIVDNGDIWFNMITSRNNAAHVYDEETAQEMSFVVSSEYMEVFRKLKSTFEKYKQEQ
jgi:hypothetical protein